MDETESVVDVSERDVGNVLTREIGSVTKHQKCEIYISKEYR